MKVIKRTFVTLIAMLAIIGAAYAVDKGISLYKDKVFEQEREQRYVEVTETTQTHKEEIEEISKLSTEEIEEYIQENSYREDYHPSGMDIDPWETDEEQDATGETTENQDNDWEAGTEQENVDRVAQLGYEAVKNMNSVSGNEVSEDSVSGNSVSSNSVSGNSVSGNSVSGNSVSGNSVSGNSVSGNSVSGNSVSGNSLFNGSVSGNRIYLADRQRFRTSYEETMLWIDADNAVLKANTEDFGKLKIACLGDSITDGTNLAELYSDGEYRDYSYPSRLGEVLGAEVSNFGIGGSSYGRYWDKAFCERYTDIPEDTDIIIVMGGDNDGYCLREDMVGSMENREYRTLYGDLDELMRGLKENYPEAEVIFMTPMPNLLHDVLRKERPELLSQTVVVNAVTSLADEYGFSVIDLYNSNFFDSHDADIVSKYIPDSVHPNEEGYELFARHVAAEIVRIHEAKEQTDADAEEESDNQGNENSEDEPMPQETEVSKEESDEESSEEETEISEEKPKEFSGTKKVIYAREQ